MNSNPSKYFIPNRCRVIQISLYWKQKKKREKKLDHRYFVDKSSREIVFFLPLKNS